MGRATQAKRTHAVQAVFVVAANGFNTLLSIMRKPAFAVFSLFMPFDFPFLTITVPADIN